jgi:MFS family permease
VALLFAMLQGGTSWAWLSLPSIGLFAISAVLLVLFLMQERRTPEPILPLTLFNNRIIAVSSIGGVILGVLMFGITSYVPLFVQGVMGGTATSAGLTLGPLLLAWPIAATFSGRIVIRYGYRFTSVLGMGLATLGTGMVMLYNTTTTLPFIIVSMFIIGTGLGFCSTAFIISVQNAVPWKLRGVATATTQFFRTIGGTIGVALMGTILNAQMASRFPPIFAHFASAAARLPKNVAPSNVLLTPNVRVTLPTAFLDQLQTALAQSLFWVYMLTFVLAAIGLVSMFLLPGGRAEKYAYKAAEGTLENEEAEHSPAVSSLMTH